MLEEAHNQFILLIRQIEEEYSKKYITLNLHLALHINQCCLDYGPLYAFWCFSFERMNGYLSSLPNSHQKIEQELMRRIMQDFMINYLINQASTKEWLDLLPVRKTIRSLASSDQFETDELRRFLQMSRSIETSSASGVENFPGEFLNPSKIHIIISDELLNILLDYYSAAYPEHSFQIPFSDIRDENSILIRLFGDQFGRLRIGSEVFGSTMSIRHIRNSFIMANFINQDGVSYDTYVGQIQYFIRHIIEINNNQLEHNIAFVHWYKPASNSSTRFFFGMNEDDEQRLCNIELWDKEFFPISRDCLILIHQILNRFVAGSYKLAHKKSSKEYIAVIPINRKISHVI